MKRLRVIQIGICHEHANGKLETLRSLKDDFEVVGFVDDRSSATPRWPLMRPESLWDGIPTMTLDEALALPDLDAAFVEVTNAELVGVAERVLERGLPMHMDKPGGESYAPFERLRTGAKSRGLPFQMGYMFRGNPAMRWIADAVRAATSARSMAASSTTSAATSRTSPSSFWASLTPCTPSSTPRRVRRMAHATTAWPSSNGRAARWRQYAHAAARSPAAAGVCV